MPPLTPETGNLPSVSRRSILRAVGTGMLGSLAGCSALGTDRPPAGSLRFTNDDNLPHMISVRVTDVGATLGSKPGTVTGTVTVPPAQRSLEASATIAPTKRQTYTSVFTEPVWYAVQFTLDGDIPENDTGTTVFHPVPPDADTGRFLIGYVSADGEFSWRFGSTTDTGNFDH
ncbi:MAG: hypothetical protein ABEI52_08440 [Halobacteriaceae archaeon]